MADVRLLQFFVRRSRLRLVDREVEVVSACHVFVDPVGHRRPGLGREGFAVDWRPDHRVERNQIVPTTAVESLQEADCVSGFAPTVAFVPSAGIGSGGRMRVVGVHRRTSFWRDAAAVVPEGWKG